MKLLEQLQAIRQRLLKDLHAINTTIELVSNNDLCIPNVCIRRGCKKQVHPGAQRCYQHERQRLAATNRNRVKRGQAPLPLPERI